MARQAHRQRGRGGKAAEGAEQLLGCAGSIVTGITLEFFFTDVYTKALKWGLARTPRYGVMDGGRDMAPPMVSVQLISLGSLLCALAQIYPNSLKDVRAHGLLLYSM